jgi:hypothetical protein
MTVMKMKRMAMVAGVLAAALLVAGCVGTVSGRKTAAVPLVKDRVEGRYERPAGMVFEAAKEVVRFNGTLVNEITRHQTNGFVRALEGRVQERKVFIAVEEVDPRVSSVVVQVRTTAGGRDLDLAHELEKQIALRLVR